MREMGKLEPEIRKLEQSSNHKSRFPFALTEIVLFLPDSDSSQANSYLIYLESPFYKQPSSLFIF